MTKLEAFLIMFAWEAHLRALGNGLATEIFRSGSDVMHAVSEAYNTL